MCNLSRSLLSKKPISHWSQTLSSPLSAGQLKPSVSTTGQPQIQYCFHRRPTTPSLVLSPPSAHHLKSSSISTFCPPIADPPQILPILLCCGFAILYCGFSVVFVMLYLVFLVYIFQADFVCATFDSKES